MNPNLRKSLIINGTVWRFMERAGMSGSFSVFCLHWMTASWSAATCRRFPRRDVSRRNKARTCPRTPQNLRLAIRFMESLLSTFRMHWDHEQGRRNGARLCEPQHVALQTKPLRVTDPRSEIRFMESLLATIRMHSGP